MPQFSLSGPFAHEEILSILFLLKLSVGKELHRTVVTACFLLAFISKPLLASAKKKKKVLVKYSNSCA